MKIYCEVSDENTRTACSVVMKHYQDLQFHQAIKLVPKFNHTDLSSYDVSKKLYDTMPFLEIFVKPYAPKLPWSKAIGYAEGNTIWVNTRKLYLSKYDRIENIFHEATHLCGFSHNGNRVTAYNLKTVPYLSASIFKQHVYKIYE